MSLTTIPPDVQRIISEGRSVKDIIDLCRVHPSLNQAICNNRAYWIQLAKEQLTENPAVLEKLSVPQIKRDLYSLEKTPLNRKVSLQRPKYPIKLIQDFARSGYDKAIDQAFSSIIQDGDLTGKYYYPIIAIITGAVEAGNLELLSKYSQNLFQWFDDIILEFDEPQRIAVRRLDYPIIDWLAKISDNDLYYAIKEAARLAEDNNEYRQLLDYLLSITRDDEGRKYNWVIEAACETGDWKLFNEFYPLHVGNEVDYHCLKGAIEKNQAEFVDYMLEHGNINEVNATLIASTFQRPSSDVARRAFHELLPRIQVEGSNLLADAVCQTDDMDIINTLINRATQAQHRRAFHRAIDCKKLDLADRLRQYVNQNDLNIAFTNAENLAVIRYLLPYIESLQVFAETLEQIIFHLPNREEVDKILDILIKHVPFDKRQEIANHISKVLETKHYTDDEEYMLNEPVRKLQERMLRRIRMP